MIGARQLAGSRISNGGDSSPSNWVILASSLGRHFSGRMILAEKPVLYAVSLSVITTDLPSKKSFNAAGTGLRDANRAASLIRNAFRRKLPACPKQRRAVRLHPKFTSHRAK